MDFLREITELFGRQQALLIPIAIIMVSVLAAIAIFNAVGRNISMESRRFRMYGLFLGIGVRGSIRLACSWVKLVLMIYYLTAFTKLDIPQYVLFVIPGLIHIIAGKRIKALIPGILLFVLELAGLLVSNLICGYIKDMFGGTIFVIVYIAIAVLVGIFSIYLFLVEVNNISEERSINPEYEYRKNFA